MLYVARGISVAFVTGLLMVLGSCRNKPAPKPEQSPPAYRWYLVEIAAEGYSPVPFFLKVKSGDPVAVIDNGEETLELEATVSDTDVAVRFPVFGTELTLRKDGDGWAGHWLAAWRFGRDFPLRAKVVDEPAPLKRFPEQGKAELNMGGQWRVEIQDFGVGRAVFRQDSRGVLSGSLVPPEVGDLRYLSGRVAGNKFSMSQFDGMHASLVHGTIEDGGQRLIGEWVYPGVGKWAFTARRGDAPTVASLVSAKLREGETRITLPELERFKGKPVIVDLFGTWCPACMDLTPELVRLHEKYKGQGLEILSIAIEPPEDRVAREGRLAAYRKRYGVTWDIDVRLVEDFTQVIPKEIENALGFPVTIFVRRDQTVAGVHTAFISDAARPEHKAVLDRFDEWAREIVASP